MANLVLKAPLFDLNIMPEDAPKVASKRKANLALKAPLFDLNKLPEDAPKKTSKALSFDLNFMPQDLATTSKRLRFDATKHGGFCKGMIDELAYVQLNLFACEKVLSENLKAMPKRQYVPKKVVRVPVVSNEVTERLKKFVTDEMKGSDMKLVIQKVLFESDLNAVQNRLNIPIKQVLTPDFLTSVEKNYLESNRKNELKVQVLGPRMQMYKETMGLKIWYMEKNQNYVLKGRFWSKFVNDNKDDLKVNANIQVWSFRKERQLYLGIVCVDIPSVAVAAGEIGIA